MSNGDTWADWYELEVLQSKFIHLVDRRNFDALRALYTDDAIEDRGAYVGDVDGMIAWAKSTYTMIEMTAHIMTNLLCHFDGDTAESECREITYVRLAAPYSMNITIVSRQFDKYRRENGVWLFSHRALCTDWSQVMPEMPPFAAIEQMPLGVAGPTDPVFSRLPGLAAALHGQ